MCPVCKGNSAGPFLELGLCRDVLATTSSSTDRMRLPQGQHRVRSQAGVKDLRTSHARHVGHNVHHQ